MPGLITYSVKLYTSLDLKHCRAILRRGLTWEEASTAYEAINLGLGHKRDKEGDIVVLCSNGPYALIDDDVPRRLARTKEDALKEFEDICNEG